MFRSKRVLSRGSAAAQCGEALPHRRAWLLEKEAAPPLVEAQPRRKKLKSTLSVSRRLTAMCGGRAARAIYYFNRHIAGLFSRPYGTQNKFPSLTSAMNRWAIFTASLRDALFLLTAHRALFTLLLLSAFCLLLTAFTPSLTVGLLPRVFSQNETPSPPAQPTPAASP